MYLVKPESLISSILFPSWFSASVKDTIYLLSTRRNLARKVRYVFFITNCRIFDLLVCGRRGIGSQRWLWGLSLPFTLLAVSEHSDQLTKELVRILLFLPLLSQQGRLHHKCMYSQQALQGFWGFELTIWLFLGKCKHVTTEASLPPPNNSLNQN